MHCARLGITRRAAVIQHMIVCFTLAPLFQITSRPFTKFPLHDFMITFSLASTQNSEFLRTSPPTLLLLKVRRFIRTLPTNIHTFIHKSTMQTKHFHASKVSSQLYSRLLCSQIFAHRFHSMHQARASANK